jgi:Ca2+-binding RTX toxin-like protein
VAANFTSTGNAQIANIENVLLTAAVTLNLANQTEAFTITGSSGADTITSGSGADTLTGGSGADSIGADDGDDVINGAQDDTLLDGGANTDTLQVAANFTSTGNAQIANIENVLLTAAVTLNLANQTEAFTITGSSGNDAITSGSGNDTITGGAGNDAIISGTGNDVVTLNGGTGNDTMTGGAGNDVFDYNAASDSGLGLGNRDVITDFHSDADSGSENDAIDLSTIDAIAGEGDDPFTFVANATPAVNPGVLANSITWYQSGGNTIVQLDNTGDTTAEFEIEMTGLHTLADTDFIL